MFLLGNIPHSPVHTLRNPFLMVFGILTFEELSSLLKIFCFLSSKQNLIEAESNAPPFEANLVMNSSSFSDNRGEVKALSWDWHVLV